jgi:hypothetical protein
MRARSYHRELLRVDVILSTGGNHLRVPLPIPLSGQQALSRSGRRRTFSGQQAGELEYPAVSSAIRLLERRRKDRFTSDTYRFVIYYILRYDPA